MNSEELKNEILNFADIAFEYNGKPSGITNDTADSKAYFEIWYGEKTKRFDDPDELMKAKFFDGKSLEEICDGLELTIW